MKVAQDSISMLGLTLNKLFFIIIITEWIKTLRNALCTPSNIMEIERNLGSFIGYVIV